MSTITVQQIAQEVDPIRRAALIHCRWFYTPNRKWIEVRNRLVDESNPDSQWPHDGQWEEFWEEVDRIGQEYTR